MTRELFTIFIQGKKKKSAGIIECATGAEEATKSEDESEHKGESMVSLIVRILNLQFCYMQNVK